MKTFLLTAIAFALLPALGGVLPELHLTTARLDLHLPFILFLALTGPGIEGALGAFAIGYFVELQSGHPMGLWLSATMCTFVVARLFSPLIDARSALGFGAIAFGFDLIYGFTALALASLGPLTGSGSAASVLWTALLTAPAAALCWPLFDAIEQRLRKKERGGLRLR